MQDRYTGDLGDYLKFGLLRWLTAGTSAPRLGVVWYRTADETHNGDGKHTAYLRDGHATAPVLRPLDPELYDRLSALVGSGRRSTAALAEAQLLPAGTVYFNELLHLDHVPAAARATRTERRRAWLGRALAATSGCDLVFADPDNGIRSKSHSVGSHRNRAVKHAYLDELAVLATRGGALVVYHHADRSAPAAVQAQRRLSDLAGEAGVAPIAAVRASRGTTRFYLVAATTAPTGAYLTRRLRELTESPWRSELAVHWPA